MTRVLKQKHLERQRSIIRYCVDNMCVIGKFNNADKGIIPAAKKGGSQMKKNIVMAAVAVGVLVMANGAFAAAPLDVQVDVTANVTQKCDVAANGTLDITIDPAASAVQNFTAVQPQAKCTKTKGVTTAAVTATSLNSFKLVGTAGEAAIPYTFTKNATVVGNGFGSGASDVDFNIGGSIAAVDANAADYGSYTDTVTLTLAY